MVPDKRFTYLDLSEVRSNSHQLYLCLRIPWDAVALPLKLKKVILPLDTPEKIGLTLCVIINGYLAIVCDGDPSIFP